MKKKIISFFLIIFQVAVFSQNNTQETLSKFIISDATKNGNDITETILDKNGYLVFYTNNDNNLYMANVWQKNDTQSFGRLYNNEHKKIKETYETFEADVFYFKWRYINSYNTKKGTASVELIKIYKPQGVVFKITIITENLDILVYKGYMEGTLDLNKYSN
jgi:hypothetical protein